MNCTKKTPQETPFIGMLASMLDRRLSDTDRQALHAAYEDYVNWLHELTLSTRKTHLDLLHELARHQSRLMQFQDRITEPNTFQASLLKSSLMLTNFEIRLLFTRLRHPSISAPVTAEMPKSPLYLSKEHTLTDLMELIAALQISGAVRRADGSQIDLKTLVDTLSRAFNVRINNPDQCRHAVINRKLRLTGFLDFLRNHLIEYSQR